MHAAENIVNATRTNRTRVLGRERYGRNDAMPEQHVHIHAEIAYVLAIKRVCM